jgi:hypothetical protein
MRRRSPPTNDRRWLDCRSAAAEAIEAYSVVQVQDVVAIDGRPVLEVRHADTEAMTTRPLAALGPARLSPGVRGWCTMQWPALVRLDGFTSALGQVMGPTDLAPGVVMLAGQGFVTLGSAVPDPWRVPAVFGWQYFRCRKIRFQLPSSPLENTHETAEQCAVVQLFDGYKVPPQNPTVWNLPISQDYLFSAGPEGYGLAVYDHRRDRYWMLTTECP